MADLDPSPPMGPSEPNLQPGIIATVIIIAILIDVVVVLRLLTRKLIVKSLSWDDWTIVAAAVGNNIGCALVLVEVHYGFGRHKYELSKEAYIQVSRFTYIEWIQTFQTLMFTKVSICLFLLRIVINRAFVYSLWSLIGMLVISNFVLTFVWIGQCRPTWLAWESPMQPGSCFNELQLRQIILAQAIISAASDFILAAYPIFILRKLKMPLRTKVGLCVLMGLGVITGGFCLVRTVGNWQNINQDTTWNSVPNWYWRSWEICVGIFAACIPALRPGYKSVYGRCRDYAHSLSSKTGSKKSEKTLPSSAFSNPSYPKYTAAALPNEASKPLPALPANTLRPDLRAARAAVGTEISYDSLHLPIQDTWGGGIVKTTRVDLESQQAVIGGDVEEAASEPRASGWDSRTALRGKEELM